MALLAGRLPLGPNLCQQLASRLQQALDLTHKPHLEVVQQLGRNCHMPNACQTPLHVILHCEWLSQQPIDAGLAAAANHTQCTSSSSGSSGAVVTDAGTNISSSSSVGGQEVFVCAIRDALRAGGCCASRAGFAGALLGGLLGPSCLPQSWADRCSSYGEVEAAAELLCKLRVG